MPESRDVWSALANPVRRQVLDLLRDGPVSTGELAASFTGLSRFAVMQHLQVLEDAGLLLVRRSGRVRLNFLNPAPLQEVRERWLNRFSEQAAQAALALRRHIKTTAKEIDMSETGTARAVRVESEFTVAAPASRVFDALCQEQHRWYPYTYGGERVRDIVFEPRVGGAVYEDWGHGAGHSYGTVVHYDPPTEVVLRGGLAGGTVLENAFALSEAEGVTTVRHSMTAFGSLTEEEIGGIRAHGDMSLHADALRAWVERREAVRS